MRNVNRKELGRWGEEVAANYLRRQGFNILERNYRCRAGEIDIIAQKGNSVVFVEVKTRRFTAYGMPAEAVDRRKVIKYTKIAAFYIKEKKLKDGTVYRFDVVEVLLEGSGAFSINHIPDAFRTDGGFYV